MEARYRGQDEWHAAIVTRVYHNSCDVVYTGDVLLQEGTDVLVKTEGSKQHTLAKIIGRYLEVCMRQLGRGFPACKAGVYGGSSRMCS